MVFDKEICQYLRGDKFSNNLKILISGKEKTILSRIKIAEDFSSHKKIVHVGCCDHLPLIKSKIEKNTWLHSRITNVAERCIGIDIDEQAIQYVKTNFDYSNIFFGDVTKKDTLEIITNDQWDGMILGEILEHIDNPVEFLSAIRVNYKLFIKKLFITVPNAFYITNFRNAKNHCETLNSDHRYWFTPYTLANIAYKSGYTVDNFFFVQEISKRIGMRAKFKLLPYIVRKLEYYHYLKYPALRSTLVMTLNFNAEF